MAIIIDGGEVTYYINISPSKLTFYKSTNDTTIQNVSVRTSQNAAEQDMPKYRIQFGCYTNQYGYDLFEVEGDQFIERNGGSGWSGNVGIKIKDLTNIPNGYYTGIFDVTVSLQRGNDPWMIVQSQSINLALTVATPTNYNFTLNKQSDVLHYTRGNNQSTTSVVSVVTDTDYVVSGPSYILLNGESLPKSLPAGNRQLTFSVASSNQLEYGLNVASISFRKINQNLGTLVLNTLQTNTNNLESSTDHLEFSHLQSVGFSDWQKFVVYAPHTTTIIKPKWIEIELESEISNVQTYKIRSISDQSIEVGNYSDEIIFDDSINQINIKLDFELYDYWNASFDREIHFTKEKEVLNLSSFQRNENNYLKLEIKGTIYDSLKGRQDIETIQNAYFFNDKALFNLGEYLHNFFDLFQNQINYFNWQSNDGQIKKMYELGKINVKVTEYNYETETIVYSYDLPAQLYMKGHLPRTLNVDNTGVLSNMGNRICRATKNSKVLAHFLTKNINSEIHVYVNQKKVETFELRDINKLSIYSLFYDFSKLDLEPGNLVDIVSENQAMQYQIIPSTPFSNHIIYIDYWGLPQIFEMIGGLDFTPKETYSNFLNSKNHHKNIGVDEEIKIKWNTGYYFRTDIPKLKEIAHSKVCWLLKGNDIIEIAPAYEAFEMFSTDNFLYSSELEFYINSEDYDACYTD
ncbi:hypothetical protein [Empedobacter sp. UBA5637]|uniref:hypothetical protein n=1 Tax=Empedobacter sp. UBA5637 TaxID=1946442 RepID=UPI0025BD855E|nr:hypothetical protein [Empedobacter sp. UBA5637]